MEYACPVTGIVFDLPDPDPWDRFEPRAAPDGHPLNEQRGKELKSVGWPSRHSPPIEPMIGPSSPKWQRYVDVFGNNPDRFLYRQDQNHPPDLIVCGLHFIAVTDEKPGRAPGGYVRDHEVRQTQKGGGTMPVSRSLPRRKGGTPDTLHGRPVLRHPDGGLTDRLGRPIVANRRDRDREEKRTGYVFDQGTDDSDT